MCILAQGEGGARSEREGSRYLATTEPSDERRPSRATSEEPQPSDDGAELRATTETYSAEKRHVLFVLPRALTSFFFLTYISTLLPSFSAASWRARSSQAEKHRGHAG